MQAAVCTVQGLAGANAKPLKGLYNNRSIEVTILSFLGTTRNVLWARLIYNYLGLHI